MSLEPGSDFGPRYRIDCQLGEGGMGTVYKAYDKELDRVVALKMLRFGLATDPAAMQRFKQELLLASRISQKNVLRIHDLGEVGGVRFISMAYVDGEDLHAQLKKHGRFTADRIVKIAQQLCAALEAAHAEGVVHRDLKPQNVLIDRADNVYISDFGLAKSVEAGAVGMTRAGEYLGTPRYMAPEQVEGQPVDRRTDLYALGLILYEMATGDVPFTGDSTLQLMYQRVKQKPKNPKILNPELPDFLARIIMRCLEREPERRYQSAREILHDLEAQSSQSASRSVQITLPIPTSRKWILLGSAVALVAVVAVVLALTVPQVRGLLFGGGKTAMQTAGEQQVVKLLIADFTNATSDSVFDGTLESALAVAMEEASFISSYDRRQARKQAAQLQPGATSITESLARLLAVREGINVVVSGTITSRDGGYVIGVKALDSVTGKEIAGFEATASTKGTVLTAVGKLAAKVRNALGDTTPESVQLAAAETFTSSSLEAAHEYAMAQESQWAGKWDEAVTHYLKAVELDPDLGRAYAGLAAAFANRGRRADAEKYYKLAFSKIDRMTDREKYRTRSGYYLVMRNPDKAIEELSQLVRQYPSDTAGISNLALAYFYRRDMARSLEEGRRAVALNPRNVPQRNNVGLYAMYAGDFETAIREQQGALDMNPSFALAYVGMALSQLAQGQTAEAAATYQRLAQIGPEGASAAAMGLADLALYEGRSADAVDILEQAIAEDLKNGNSDGAADKYSALTEGYLLMGNSAKALAAAEKALAASTKDGVMFWAARAYLSSGREAKALAIAKELGKRFEPEPQAYAKLIEGEVELKRGRATEAVKLFSESLKPADTWLGRFALGRAYLAAGAYTEAGSEFDACQKRRGEATAAFLDEVPTFRLWPTLHYYLGRVQEGLSSPGAAEAYKTFLSFKKDGGQDPLVADARRRLANR